MSAREKPAYRAHRFFSVRIKSASNEDSIFVIPACAERTGQMKTIMMLIAVAMLFSGCAACRNPELNNAAGVREFTQPPESTQPMDEKSRGSERATGNGDGMQNFVAGEIIVKFKSGVSREAVERIAREHGLEIVKIVSPPQLYLFRITGKVSAGEVLREFNVLNEVEYAEPNYTRQTQ